MMFIRTVRQHGIAGNIVEGIEIKTETIFLLEKERKKIKGNLCSAGFTVFWFIIVLYESAIMFNGKKLSGWIWGNECKGKFNKVYAVIYIRNQKYN